MIQRTVTFDLLHRNRRHLGIIAAFSGVAVLLISILNVVFTQATMWLDPNERKVQEVLSMEDSELDIVYLGNSIVQQAINPVVVDDALGTKSYNLALGGAGFIEMEAVLRHFIAKNGRPDLLVYGIAINRGSDGSGIRPSVLAGLDDESRRVYRAYRSSRGLERNWLKESASRLPFYRFRAAPERLVKYAIDGQERVPTWKRGHLALDLNRPPPARHAPHEAGLDGNGLDHLLKYAAEIGVPVVLVECPNSPSYNQSVKGRSDVMAELTKVVGDRATFISLNMDLTPYDDSDWVALNHFNRHGAVKFSELLSDQLREISVRLGVLAV